MILIGTNSDGEVLTGSIAFRVMLRACYRVDKRDIQLSYDKFSPSLD